jgi:hypothetical protein
MDDVPDRSTALVDEPEPPATESLRGPELEAKLDALRDKIIARYGAEGPFFGSGDVPAEIAVGEYPLARLSLDLRTVADIFLHSYISRLEEDAGLSFRELAEREGVDADEMVVALYDAHVSPMVHYFGAHWLDVLEDSTRRLLTEAFLAVMSHEFPGEVAKELAPSVSEIGEVCQKGVAVAAGARLRAFLGRLRRGKRRRPKNDGSKLAAVLDSVASCPSFDAKTIENHLSAKGVRVSRSYIYKAIERHLGGFRPKGRG